MAANIIDMIGVKQAGLMGTYIEESLCKRLFKFKLVTIIFPIKIRSKKRV